MATKALPICVLESFPGMPPHVIRSGPTPDEVRSFVEAHNQKAANGHLEGPDSTGQIALEITSAKMYASEDAWLQGKKGKPVDLSFTADPEPTTND